MSSKELQRLLKPQHRLKEVLDRFDDVEADLLLGTVKELLKQRGRPSIEDVWYSSEEGLSFWVLFLNGVDDSAESELAKQLLFWREISSGSLASVRCIPSSERALFSYCAGFVGFSSAPTLVISTDRRLTECIRLEEGVLSELLAKKSLQRFLTKVHTRIVKGDSLGEIEKSLRSERFWRTVRVVYSEVKDFVSLQASLGS